MVAKSKVTLVGFDLRTDIKQAIRRALPAVGDILTAKMRSKIGIYQHGWPPLSPYTIARKRTHVGSKRWGLKRRRKFLKTMGTAILGDTPLLDWGTMRQSIRHREQGNTTRITVDFPAVVHEQDNELGVVLPSKHTPPKRPFIVPSLEESWEPIVKRLEDEIGGLF